MLQLLPEVFLQRALTAYLYGNGHQVREEVPFGNVRFDTIALKDGKIMGFEVKLTSWARAFKQADVYKLCCDAVSIAIPASRLTRAVILRCKQKGVGLVTIGLPPDWDIVQVLEAPPSTLRNRIHHQGMFRIAKFR